MEVAAAVASVTGIIGFAGQAIDGIIKLQRLFQGCINASKSIDQFLRDLNSLIQTLEEAKEIAIKLKDTSGAVADGLLASLEIQLEDCEKDVYSWVRKARQTKPALSSGTKATFKKFLEAVNKEQNDMIYRDIANHRSHIHTKLSIIGRSLDIEHTSGLRDLSSKVAENNKITLAALEDLQSCLGQSPEGLKSPISLASLASSLSRIENILVSSRPGSIGSWHGSGRSQAGSAGSAGSFRRRRGLAMGIGDANYPSAAVNDLLGLSTHPEWEEVGAVLRLEPELDLTASEKDQRAFVGATKVEPQETKPETKPIDLLDKAEDPTLSKFEKDLQIANIVEAQDITAKDGPPFAIVKGQIEIRRAPSGLICTNCFAKRWQLASVANVEGLSLKYEPLCMECASYFKQYSTARPITFVTPIAGEDAATRASASGDIFNSYLTLMHRRASLRIQLSLLMELSWSIPAESQKLYNESTIRNELEGLEERIRNTRASCWQKGHDIDVIDRFLATCPGYCKRRQPLSDNNTNENGHSESRNEDAHPLLSQRNLAINSTEAWISRLDYINFWLLQKLCASDKEVKIHKSILHASLENQQTSQDLVSDDKEWSRMVLKHWPLDSAALAPDQIGPSTNGAVDSAGLPHEARVVLNLNDLDDKILSQETIDEKMGGSLNGAGEAYEALHFEVTNLEDGNLVGKASNGKAEPESLITNRSRIWKGMKRKLRLVKAVKLTQHGYDIVAK